MLIKKDELDIIWYENEAGEKWIPPMDGETHQPPKGYIFQHTQFPNRLQHEIVMVLEGGSSTQVMTQSSGWQEDLVLALAVSKNWTLGEAILIAANSCERCMNAMAYEYGLIWGYAIYSEEWHQTNTQCNFCKTEPINITHDKNVPEFLKRQSN